MGYLYALISSFFLGITPILAKYAISVGFSPLIMPASRFFTLSLLGIFFFLLKRNMRPIKRQTLTPLCLFMFGSIITSYSYLTAISFIAISQAAIIFYSFPIIIFTLMICQKKIPWSLPIAIIFCIAFSGLSLINFPFDISFNSVGLILAFSASFGAVLQFMTAKSLINHYTKYELLFLINIMAFPFTVLMYITFTEYFILTNHLWGWLSIIAGNILYLLGYVFLYATLSRLRPDIAGLMFNCEPLTSIIIATILFSKTMASHQIVGSLCILFAISSIHFFTNKHSS